MSATDYKGLNSAALDLKAHPWPADDKIVSFRLRKAIWPLVRPWYGYHEVDEIRRCFPITFWFPFFSIRTKWFHFYIGWKPLNLNDMKFYWRHLIYFYARNVQGKLFVQCGIRWGWKETS